MPNLKIQVEYRTLLARRWRQRLDAGKMHDVPNLNLPQSDLDSSGYKTVSPVSGDSLEHPRAAG